MASFSIYSTVHTGFRAACVERYQRFSDKGEGDVSLSENLQDSEVAAVHTEGAPASVEIFFFSGSCNDEFHIMFQYCNNFIFGGSWCHQVKMSWRIDCL